MRTTVHDVADAAGVSVSTVSRALTGGSVSPATRATVMAAAERLGYRPNRTARGLITGRTGNYGLIVPDLRNPFFADIAKGVSARARAVDCGVFITDTDEDVAAELEALATLGRNTDGVLLCSPRATDAELLEAADPDTTVLVHRQAPGMLSIAADIAAGTRQAMDHLRALGHRQIAFLAGPDDSWAGRERLAALADYEILRFGSVAPTFEGGVLAGDLVLASPATAVLAYNDLVAMGLLHRLAARGVSVPDQMSVVGYDDISLAAMSHPPLTTVAVPKGRAGAAALELLLRRAGKTLATVRDREVTLPTGLVVRSSSGVAPT
ncbi:putative LacI-family transcriptional regulator [Actinoplanes missouriensis 431]|uniref:Putative LacI-family transcriptional regulator n=1 Tax=Actinoplanes missouriensis (strain ATCC 14538 / DSM 43046 / CBS 188.64 / JCM 3121 / NBRC 102363 / NCIMB 12654 / NRRL B-3342 / UNCC 431) TaxID=512565 RepID=I0HA40_ACTM4|nr:LacI family DNA-binding transcriptional regulator [Actinoplanes missouriensis]BAL89877.1 putative LacI-family transcriptional regulator [Actinoplanes missouriensis 431]